MKRSSTYFNSKYSSEGLKVLKESIKRYGNAERYNNYQEEVGFNFPDGEILNSLYRVSDTDAHTVKFFNYLGEG